MVKDKKYVFSGKPMDSNKSFYIGLALVLAIFLIALVAPKLAPQDPLEVNIGMRFQAPSVKYWLGTDNLGRCIASRIIWGTRLSIFYGLGVLVIMLLISIPLGTLAAYVGGKVDGFIMSVVDLALSIPTFLLGLAVAGALGASSKNMMIAMSSVWWASYTRMIRSFALQIKQQEFMLAAQGAGCSHIQLLVHHILRNILPSILVVSTMQIGSIIMHISTFSFIGLGAQPPAPEWGVMLSDSKEFIQTQPQLMIYPGIAIFITVIAFNLLGEGLKNELRQPLP